MAAMRSRPDRILVWMCVLIAVNQLGFGGIVPVLALYSRSFAVSQSAIGVAIAVYGLARFLVAMPAGRSRMAWNAVARTGALFNVVPVLAEDRLGLSPDRIGLGLALASLVGLAVTYPSGALVDRYGRKSVIVPATFLAGVSLLLFLLAPSYAWFLAGCVVWSVASGVGGAAPAAYAADVAPPGMNAAAMSAFRMLADLGYVVGPIALGLSTDLAGANATLAGTAVLLAATALLFARFAPESHQRGDPSGAIRSG